MAVRWEKRGSTHREGTGWMQNTGARKSPGLVQVSGSHSPGQKSRFSGENVEGFRWGSVWAGLSVEYQGGDRNPRAGLSKVMQGQCHLWVWNAGLPLPIPTLHSQACASSSFLFSGLHANSSHPGLHAFSPADPLPRIPFLPLYQSPHPSGSSWSPRPPRDLE